MPIKIAITNQKGGVGKTTTSVNLGASLAELNYKVLLIDLDPQGHSTSHLSSNLVNKYQEIKENYTINDLFKNQLEPEKIVKIYQNQPNLHLLSSDLKLGSFNQANPTGLQFKLKESLPVEFLEKYDFVIIDCQPSLSLLTLNALTLADYVLLPVQAEFLALDGLSQLIITLKEVRTKLHPKLSVIGVLLTMFDVRNRLSTEVYNELQKNFGYDLLEQVIPRNIKLAEAPSFGKSILEYDSSCIGAKSYRNLATEILTRLKLI